MEHFRKLERMYAAAPINVWFQPQLHVDHGRAEVVIGVRAEFHHSAGSAHGTVYFKAMDDAAFFAANSLVADVFVLTARIEIELLRPVVDGDLRAVGRVTGQDDRRIYAEAEAFDGRGELVGRARGSFARSKIPLSPAVHYL
jgi:uncharacterized protein (TIGR00369 family)